MALICAAAKLIAQVDLQTGNLQLGFPIYNYSDEKTGLSSSVSLSYSSRGGIKTDQMASPAGLGFDLIAGGYIQRVQVGAPDDQKMRPEFAQSATCLEVPDWRTYLTTHATMSDNSGSISPAPYINNYFPNGYLYSEYPITVADASIGTDCRVPYSKGFIPLFKENENKLWKQSRHSLADHEQDIFVFNINGRSGQFVIGRNREIRTMPQSKMKVVFDDSQDLYAQGIRTKITSFTITDENGFKYSFDKYETSEVTEQTEISRDAGSTTLVKSESRPKMIKQFVITKWFLTKIEPPFVTARKITFEYAESALTVRQGYFTTLNNQNGSPDKIINVAEQIAYLKTWQLRKIAFPDGEYIKFHYETIGRVDIPGMNPVKEITFFTDDKYAGGALFEYGYFYKKQINDYGFGVPDSKYARLCLKKFQLVNIAGEREPPYVFEYNTGSSSTNQLDIVAPPFSFARDHWGYYNKMASVGESYAIPQKDILSQIMLPVGTTYTNRVASDNAASLGLLNSYILPQGGKISIEYAQNKFQHPQLGNIMAGGVSVSKITKNALDGVSAAMATSYSYLNTDGTSSLWGYEAVDKAAYNYFKSINQYNDNSFKYAGDIKSEQVNALRIIAIASNIVNYAEKAYQIYLVAKTISSGAQLAITAGSFASTSNIALMWLSIMFKLYMNNRELNTVTDYFFYDPLWSGNPVGFQYSRAIVKSISANNPNGEVIYEYSKPLNSLISYNSDIPAINFPYSNKPRYNYWKYGNLLKTQIKNQGGTVIAETINGYEFVETTVNDVNFRSIKFDVSSMYAGKRDLTPSAYQQYINLQWDAYYFNPGRAQVSKTTIKNYDGEMATKETNYSYNTSNFQLESSNTKMSDGTVSGQTIFYPTVTTTDVPITKLKNANVLNVPIAQMSWMKDSEAASVKKLKAASATIFQEVLGFGIKPFKIYASELSQPAVSTIQDSYLPENIGSYSILKLKKTISYNEYLPIQQTENEGMTSSTIYGYNKRFPIATATNAVYTDVGASSFETAGEGGFAYNTENVSADYALTGKNCFVFPAAAQASVSKTGLNTGKEYMITFWLQPAYGGNGVPLNDYVPIININNQTSGGYPVTYTNPQLVAYSGKGWFLYAAKVQGAHTVKIINFKSGVPYSNPDYAFPTKIDEVRICPIDAAMTTRTWDPLFGKTSETDPNNKTTFYDYDGSARVRLVRDMDGNILKKTCYNMAGQPENCSGIRYGNDVQQRTIGRSNCPPYNLPSGVSYTVPKDKYVSFISKDDANIQAQHEIDLNGSAYANDPANGATCTPYCYFEFQAGISSVYSNITKSGTTISFTVVFSNTFTGITPNGQSITLGNIRNGCAPSVLRTVEVSENGRVWYVLIYPSGQMQTILKSGSSPSVGPAIALVGSFIL